MTDRTKRSVLVLFVLLLVVSLGLLIRNKLLLWRLRNFNKVDLKAVEFGFPELETFDRRVQQVITPIYYFSDESIKKEILLFAREQEEETKRERRENLDGKIFEFIYENRTSNITISLIHDYLNKGKQKEVSERRIGGIIRSVLGFDIDRVGHENIRTIVLEKREDKIADLAKYYGCESTNTINTSSETRVAQDASVADDLTDSTLQEIFGK